MMKRSIRLVFVVMGIMFFTVFSCQKFDALKSPVDGFDVFINYDIFETFVTLRFVDAPSGELIGSNDDEKVLVKISGLSADAIVDQVGNQETNFKSIYGVVSVALNPKEPWVPSRENILLFTIEASSERYKSVDYTIGIDSTGQYVFDIYMEALDVDEIGFKEYTHKIQLDEEFKLSETFMFSSTNHEASIVIPQGTQFLDSLGNVVQTSQVKTNLKIYQNKRKSSVPYTLVANLQEGEGQTSKVALDIYKIVEVSMRAEDGTEIKAVALNEVELRYALDSAAYHPLNKRAIEVGDGVISYTYEPETKVWTADQQMIVQGDSLGYYAIAQLDHFSTKVAGNNVSTCTLSGEVQFNFLNEFEILPVGARMNLYRKRDNMYLMSKLFNVTNSGQKFTYEYTSIADEPIRFYIYNASNSNSFSATPSSIYLENGCNTIPETLVVDIASNRVQVDGTVSLSFDDELPAEDFDVYLDIYRKGSASRLFRKKYTLNKSVKSIAINTGLPANNDVDLTITPLNNDMAIGATPKLISFNTSTGPFAWAIHFESSLKQSEIQFGFDFDTGFQKNEVWMKATFMNWETRKIEKSLQFKVSKDTPTITRKIGLSKNTHYKINLKRVAGEDVFMAYPYKFHFETGDNKPVLVQSELFPVHEEQVDAKINVICGSSIIIPTMNGMLRTVWDESWTDTQIVEGEFTKVMEIGAMYEFGVMLEGDMEIAEVKIESTKIDMDIELKSGFCEKMGW